MDSILYILSENVTQIVAMGGLLILSTLFSASETALFSIRRYTLRTLEKSPGVINGLIVKLRNSPRILLISVLLGNLFVNLSYYSFSTDLSIKAAKAVGGLAALAIGIVNFLILLLVGEILAKSVAVSIPLRLAKLLVLPVYVFSRIIVPLAHILENITEFFSRPLVKKQDSVITTHELQQMIEASQEQGVLDKSESRMLKRALVLDDVKVKEVMVPRVDVVIFDLGGGKENLKKLFQETKQTKIPVFSGNTDSIKGVVYAKDLFAQADETSLESIVRKASYIPETAHVENVLLEFRKTKRQMGIVVDEYGDFSGIITLEDIIEENCEA